MKTILTGITLLLFACQIPLSKNEPNKKPAEQKVGADKDTHGCLTSAGYTWSVVKDSCVRLFEAGIRLQPQDTAMDQTVSAFIIFNTDQTKAELFLPGKEGSLLLERKGEEGTHSWESGNVKLFPWKGYVLKDGDKTIFHGQ